MTLDDAIEVILTLGQDYCHEHERLPWDFCLEIARQPEPEQGINFWGVGLLCLVFGVANWGAKQATIRDPRGDMWAGRPKKRGKHLADGTHYAPHGGLHLPHWDGRGNGDGDFRDGILERVYAAWGRPLRFKPGHVELDFASIMRTDWAGHWLDWSTKLYENPDFHAWSIKTWLRRYWEPSFQACSGDLLRAVINSRIRHSSRGWARSFARGSAEAQIDLYVARQRRSGGERKARRAHRQVGFVRRVWAVLEAK